MPQNFIINENLLSSQYVIEACPKECSQFIIITDDIVKPLYATDLEEHLQRNHLSTQIIAIPHGEQSKSREMVSAIQDELFALGCGRDTCIIALGGGVITDLAGFVAATYCRGIPVIYLPTTLLGMVDAALGGKTGINTPYGKNLIGVFSEPKAILSDINTLHTLPELEFSCAFAEIIKHAITFDRDYFDEIAKNAEALKNRDLTHLQCIIRKSCEIKTAIVSQDKMERGIRSICNFGHTIGHALELVSDYGINHGQAVAIGIIVEAYISEQMRLLSHNEFLKIKALIARFDIPLSIPHNTTMTQLKKSLVLDKKSRDKIPRFVLINSIGTFYSHQSHYTHQVDEVILDKALHYLLNEFRT